MEKFYDEEVIKVLEDIKNPTCISLITGGGKSQSIIEFIKIQNLPNKEKI
jgi:hypothetical protein